MFKRRQGTRGSTYWKSVASPSMVDGMMRLLVSDPLSRSKTWTDAKFWVSCLHWHHPIRGTLNTANKRNAKPACAHNAHIQHP